MTECDPPTLLIVEDHVATRRFLADNLQADGYPSVEAGTLAQACEALADDRPKLLILDLGLPDGDGLELVAALREERTDAGAGLPVLVLSGRASELDRVRGLSRGADDYLVKPFGYGELLARVRSLLRRASPLPPSARVRAATLELDPRSHETWVEGTPVHLSGKEFALALMLASAPDRTFTREELLRDVWGYRTPGSTRTLDTHAHRLRRKLSVGRVTYVINVWGVGYRLTDGEGGTDRLIPGPSTRSG